MTHNDFNYKELLTFGWAKTKEHFLFLLGLFGISILLGIVTGWIPVINNIVSFLTTIAVVSVLLDIVKGHTPHYKDLLKPFQTYKVTWHYFLGVLLVMIAFAGAMGIFGLFYYLSSASSIVISLVVGIILLCAAIYATVRLQFFRYFIVEDENLGPINAFKKSLHITEGHFWKLFGFMCVIILLNLVGLLAVIVGLLVTIPVTMIAYTHLYKKLSAHAHSA